MSPCPCAVAAILTRHVRPHGDAAGADPRGPRPQPSAPRPSLCEVVAFGHRPSAWIAWRDPNSQRFRAVAAILTPIAQRPTYARRIA